MKDSTKSIVIPIFWVVMFVAAIVLLTLLIAQQFDKPEEPLGSVARANEYIATSTLSMDGGWPAANRIEQVISTSNAVLGSIIITSTTPSDMIIMNATSTTDISSTTVVTIKGSTAVGVYTFDIVMPRGLVVDVPAGFNGEYIITYRGE